MWINLVALAVILGCGYFFWVRPILMARPELKSFYEDEARVVAVVRKKIAAAVIVVGGVYVELANYIMPAITGVDTSVYTKNLPDWIVPLIPIAAVSLLNYFQHTVEKPDPGNKP